MKRFLFFSVLAFSLTSISHAHYRQETYEQYDGNGEYQGQIERKSDSKFEKYDKYGHYQGEIKESYDGKSYDYYDSNGSYKGTIKRK